MSEKYLKDAKKAFFIALGIDMAVTAVAVASDIWSADVIKNIASSGSAASQSVISSLEFWENFSKLMLLTLVGVGWTLARWIGACYTYAQDTLKVTDLRQERWKAWGWIVPFLNVFKPYQVLNEIYRVGNSAGVKSDDWKKSSGSWLLFSWWVFWVVSHLVMFSIGQGILKSSSIEGLTLLQLVGIRWSQIVLGTISIVVAATWFLVAGNLSGRLLGRSYRTSRPIMNSGSAKVSTSLKSSSSSEASSDAYAGALAEIEEQRMHKGTWAQCFAEADGDESKAKARYIQRRVAAVASAAEFSDTRPMVLDSLEDAKNQAIRAGLSFQDVEYLGKPIKAFHYLRKYQMSEDRLAMACVEKSIKWHKHDGILWVADEEVKADTWY